MKRSSKRYVFQASSVRRGRGDGLLVGCPIEIKLVTPIPNRILFPRCFVNEVGRNGCSEPAQALPQAVAQQGVEQK